VHSAKFIETPCRFLLTSPEFTSGLTKENVVWEGVALLCFYIEGLQKRTGNEEVINRQVFHENK